MYPSNDIKIDEYRGRLIEIMKNSNPDMLNEELDEAYKVYRYNQIYNEKERNLINLIETRGVAYFQYTDIIEEVIGYIKAKIPFGKYKPKGNDKKVIGMLHSGETDRYNCGFLLYRLWNKNEMNAAVESVYGCLSRRSDFGFELQSLKAYQEYKTFRDAYIPSLIYVKKEVLDEIAETLGITIKDYTKFRKWFMDRSNALNNTFLHKIVKAAGLAYENMEKDEK